MQPTGTSFAGLAQWQSGRMWTSDSGSSILSAGASHAGVAQRQSAGLQNRAIGVRIPAPVPNPGRSRGAGDLALHLEILPAPKKICACRHARGRLQAFEQQAISTFALTLFMFCSIVAFWHWPHAPAIPHRGALQVSALELLRHEHTCAEAAGASHRPAHTRRQGALGPQCAAARPHGSDPR